MCAPKSKGFTLLEVVFVLTLITILVAVVVFLYVVVLKSWDQFGRRSDVRDKIQFAMEQMVRDIRKASVVNVPSNTNTIRFTVGNSSYVYYLYNTSELRKADLSGGIGGSLSGIGDLIASGLTSITMTNSGTCNGTPSTSCVAQMTLVWTNGSETLQVNGYARPRNLL